MKILKLLFALTAVFTVFMACEDETVTNYALQDISAPQNVTANFSIAQDDTGMLTITPAGEGASTFTINWGDEQQSEVTIDAGQSASTVFEEGEYLVRVTATGATV